MTSDVYLLPLHFPKNKTDFVRACRIAVERSPWYHPDLVRATGVVPGSASDGTAFKIYLFGSAVDGEVPATTRSASFPWTGNVVGIVMDSDGVVCNCTAEHVGVAVDELVQ